MLQLERRLVTSARGEGRWQGVEGGARRERGIGKMPMLLLLDLDDYNPPIFIVVGGLASQVI
jgi:hypothetical protein